jgi:hypothetical protein
VDADDLTAQTRGGLLVRVSAQRYNRLEQYARLAETLRAVLAVADCSVADRH